MPSRMMVAVSPLATPSSMIAALIVGRYSDARVLISCSTISTATSRRYGRDVLAQQRQEHSVTVAHNPIRIAAGQFSAEPRAARG